MPAVRGHNEGSLFLRKRDRRWVAMVTMADGRRRSASAPSKSEGLLLLRELTRQRDQQVPSDPGRLRLGPYLERWLDDVKPRLAPATWRKHESIVRNHLGPRLGNRPMLGLSVGDVRDCLRVEGSKGLDPQSVRHVRATLRRALADALREGLVTRNVAALTEAPPMRRKRPTVLSAAQVKALIEGTTGDRYHALWTLAATSGMRQAEMLALTWDDIEGSMVHVRRTLHFREARLGLPKVTMHSLRHSAATVLIAEGYPIAKVAAILGHSSSRVTEMVYAHLIGKDLVGAADVMEKMYGEAR
jgi:integrase